MTVPIYIPTLNAEQSIEELLNALVNQLEAFEIILIDSSSKDKTVEIAKKFDVKVIQISRNEFNHATTRNLALQKEADFYLFMTQDALPYDEYLVENLLEPFEDEDVVVSYARQIPYEDADIIERFARETNYPKESVVKSKESLATIGIKTFFSSNSCAMYRASYFKKMGGFKEGLIMNEDMEFAARAILDGKKIAYAAKAKVWHSHRYTFAQIFRRYFDIGVFFRTNGWIEDEIKRYHSSESTGLKQVKKEMKYLWENAPFAIPQSFVTAGVKFLAYKLGKNYNKLPKQLVERMSLHKRWWEQRKTR